jgi:hypothetical protein
MQGFFTNQEATSGEFWEPEAESTDSSGFVQNMQDSFGQMRREDLPIISRNLPNETTDMRMAQIAEYRKAGVVSDEVIEFYSSNLTFGPSLDIDALTMYMRNELGLTDVATPQEYEVMRNEEYADARKTADKTFKDQTLWGAVGEFAGMMGAMATDPVYASGVFFGYGAATTAVRAAIYGGAIEMGTEIVAQPFIADWKDEIGVNYGASEMLVNVLAAGVFGGALAGGSKKIGMMISDPIDPQRMKVKDAVDRLFYGESRGFATEPVLHALSKADPQEPAIVAATRDEGITKTTNERGPRNVAKDGPVVIASKVDDIETEFDKTFAEVQAKMDEIDAAAAKPEEGVTQRTPLTDAEKTLLAKGAPLLVGKPTKKNLRKLDVELEKFKAAQAKAAEGVTPDPPKAKDVAELEVMPEITDPAARAHVAAAIDITDVIAKAEEAC